MNRQLAVITGMVVYLIVLIATTILLSQGVSAIPVNDAICRNSDILNNMPGNTDKTTVLSDNDDAYFVCYSVSLFVQALRPQNVQELDNIQPYICQELPDHEVTCKDFIWSGGQDIVNHANDPVANPVEKLCEVRNSFSSLFGEQGRISESKYTQNSATLNFAAGGLFIAKMLRLAFQAQNTKDYESRTKILSNGPIFDSDKDLHSSFGGGPRSVNWRGRDCNDYDFNVRPGVYDDLSSPDIDRNCNGIVGAINGTSYEEEFCKGKPTVSLVALGDSSIAGLRIPEQWLNPFKCREWCFIKTVKQGLVNTLDWPHLSAMTGYEQHNDKSLISYLTEHNRCNHRGYQNLAKNGDSWIDFKDQVQRFIVDDSSKPVLMTVGFTGNDVCGQSLEDMTTTEQLRGYLEDGFHGLNEKIGHKNSTVFVYGLADGGLIWPTLYNKTHPLGVSYESFYAFMTSIGANPCKTWINPDESVRRAASERAYELSQAIKIFIEEKGGEFNFEVIYEDFPQQQIIDLAQSRNITNQMLIEPVDGFHPSVVYANPLLAEVTWDLILRKYPYVVGEKNYANEAIQRIFGDQGGY